MRAFAAGVAGVAAAAAASAWASGARRPGAAPFEDAREAACAADEDDGALVVRFEAAGDAVEASPEWTLGETGWSLRFVRLPAGAAVRAATGRDTFVKVVRGRVSAGGESRGAVPRRRMRAVTAAVPARAEVRAGPAGAVLAWWHHDTAAPAARAAADVGSLRARGGPGGAPLPRWTRCDTYGWGARFDALPFFNLRGWRLVEGARRLCYVQLWAAGRGVNCGDHDHSELAGGDAFCEVHFGLLNGTGRGGMYDARAGAAPGAARLLPLLRGEEHGAYWEVDEATGGPVRRPDGSVVYGAHRWQAGGAAAASDRRAPERLDVWAAFELVPELAGLGGKE